MIDGRGEYSAAIPAREFARSGRTLAPSTPPEPAPARTEAKLRRVAAEIVRSVQSRLPGRVRDLKVRIEDDQFVLSGVSSSYYVKQVAQHVAMSALDAVMLGRLVNEIEVRAVR
jgi:hypothetical protein